MSLTPRIDRLEKNYIINGGFDIWQRGTSFSAGGDQYTADRFWNSTNGALVSQGRSTDVPTNNIRYSITGQWNNPSAQYLASQRIEGDEAIKLVGKTVTLTYYIKYTGTVTGMTTFIRIPSALDNFTTVEIIESYDVTIQASPGNWTKVSHTFTVPITSPVNSYAAANGLQIDLARISGTGTVNLYITGVMLNEGEASGEFIRAGKNIQEELALCQRYCYNPNYIGPNNLVTLGIGKNTATTTAAIILYPPVTLRIVPTLTATAAQFSGQTTTSADVALNSMSLSSNSSANCLSINIGTASSWVAGEANIVRLTGGNKYNLFLSAEL